MKWRPWNRIMYIVGMVFCVVAAYNVSATAGIMVTGLCLIVGSILDAIEHATKESQR